MTGESDGQGYGACHKFVLSTIAVLANATTAVGSFLLTPAWHRAPTAMCAGANINPPDIAKLYPVYIARSAHSLAQYLQSRKGE
jgi:hypothetical protein